MIFVIYEAYTPSPNPIVDITLFKDVRGYVCLNIISMAAGAMYIALSIIWPQRKSNSPNPAIPFPSTSSEGWADIKVTIEVVLVYSETRWETSAWMSV